MGRLRRRLIAEQIADLVAIDRRLAELMAQIKAAVADTPTGLTRLFGVGPVTTARLLGEVGDVARFRTRHHFASYNGTAPVDSSSGGGPPAYRLNTKGNRKLNHAIHMVAITQVRNNCAGRAFYLRKQAEGKTPKEALRTIRTALQPHIPDDCQLNGSMSGLRSADKSVHPRRARAGLMSRNLTIRSREQTTTRRRQRPPT
ncbi:MAG TPA: transposase [Acidimicrobiales bacterium]|nr:transposase [Acidimicrobiales bacterium]